MSNQFQLTQFRNQLTESITSGKFLKSSLGNYAGNEKGLKSIYVRKVKIKRTQMLSFTYRYETRDIIKNFLISEGISLITQLISNDFRVCTLFNIDKEVILEHRDNGKINIRSKDISCKLQLNFDHNKEKKRLILPKDKKYLQELRITDQDGQIYKNAQDKFKQINQYIEILSTLISELPPTAIQDVVDMGSGKGYLTFALYDYLHHNLGWETNVTGVEYREDLVKLCNQIAVNSNFKSLRFNQGTIVDYQINKIDLLIALHACDTATDDAIYKGIKANAQLIAVAPCCHKQIRKEIEKHKVNNELSFITKYGIFLERQAEMVTDGLRALFLEYYGYKTKVFEFISDVHTPKNVLIVGIKPLKKSKSLEITDVRKADIKQKILNTKAYFGIGYHHLEKLFELDK